MVTIQVRQKGLSDEYIKKRKCKRWNNVQKYLKRKGKKRTFDFKLPIQQNVSDEKQAILTFHHLVQKKLRKTRRPKRILPMHESMKQQLDTNNLNVCNGGRWCEAEPLNNHSLLKALKAMLLSNVQCIIILSNFGFS